VIRWSVLLAGLLALPFAMGEYYINLTSQIFIFAIFVSSINLLLGYGGLPTLGHASYLGVAAYACALLYLKAGASHFVAALLALAGTTLMAAVLRPHRAARRGARLPDAHARALAGALGNGLPLGRDDRRRQRGARVEPARRRSASTSTTRPRSTSAPWRSRWRRCG
jgi:hypothetical protein